MFTDYLRQAISDSNTFGFHFEEGGCWGMAVALYDELGGEFVVTEDFVHAYVRVGSDSYDWEGRTRPAAQGRVVELDELYALANHYGVPPEEVESDRRDAREMIDIAKEIANQHDSVT